MKNIKVEDVSRTTYNDYDPFYVGINYSYVNHQSIIVIWIEAFRLLFSESYLLVTFSLGVLANDGLGIYFTTQDVVSFEGWATNNDINLLFN